MQSTIFFNYLVQIDGTVTNIKTNKQKKHLINSSGYPYVSLFINKKREMWFIHRLLAYLFIENGNNHPVVNHKNGIKTDYSLSNLEWCSYSYNSCHAVETGLMSAKQGEDHHLAKLTNDDIIQIYELIRLKTSFAKIALMFDIKKSHVATIKTGRSYKNITKPEFFRVRTFIETNRSRLLDDLQQCNNNFSKVAKSHGICRKALRQYL